ncbi:hypothetical protein PHYPSEUDO_000422 [Phytophthora pseudosyringae]|uniref:RING-type domain-containing protein n=1 Tax=Phytophthora pseudosyringae TaxID=221518 RepID=A0A8T1W2S3_9STRA|nr:hypothetical protein PHYPSEUDO_000422 [Phytophthora pseudosyringae]
MRRTEVVVDPAPRSPSSASPARSTASIRVRVRPSASALTAADGGSGGWTLPPLNQFMTLPRRFLPASFGAAVDSSPSPSGRSGVGTVNRNRNALVAAANRATMTNLLHGEDEAWATHDRFVLPHMVHFQDAFDPSDTATGPAQQPEEIDLTLSSSEDEDGGQNAADSDDVIEILDVSESLGVPPPAPLRRKRRRPGVAATASTELVPKRQHLADITRSAESTTISMRNNEVVEEFKKRLKCSVCLDVLEDMTSTLCGHIFCAGCIHQAIRANGKCPLCQRRLHLKDTHRLFF